MKVLLLAYTESGDLSNGPAIILTHLVTGLARCSDFEIQLGLLKQAEQVAVDPIKSTSADHDAFRVIRYSSPRSNMARAALGGPMMAAERAFLGECQSISRHCDVIMWLGLAWDPVSLKLPTVCHCPVIQHPTDSITLAELNRLPGGIRRLRVELARSLETRLLNSGYSKSIYNSPKDAAFARTLVPKTDPGRIVALPIGVDTQRFEPPTKKTSRKPIRVMFSGVMNYRPNVDAALYLVNRILPRITTEVEVRLVGRNPTEELVALQRSNPSVSVTGSVPDIAAELREADIFVAPMISGGGISNKVLEAMACGLPVITTSLVADNFPDRPQAMHVGTTAAEIASKIDLLARDADLRLRLSSEAAAYIRTGKWSWDLRTDRLIEILKESTNSTKNDAA